MRNASVLIMIALLALAGGCNQDQKATVASGDQPHASSVKQQASHELTPEELGALGAEIRKTPDRAQELLSQRGLDEKSFEAQIRKVTEDADASKRYAEAYRKASA